MSKALPEYLRLRTYLYNLAMQHLQHGGKIPSENELSAMFGVSRVTVRGAIRGLIKDRLLYSQRGMGTYINTQFSAGSEFWAVGMMVGSGENAADQISLDVQQAIQMCGMHPELLFMPESGKLPQLLENARQLDAIIWSVTGRQMPPLLKDLLAENIPILVYCTNIFTPKECNLLSRDPADAGAVLAQAMKQYGHKRLLTVTSDGDITPLLHRGSTYHQAYCLMHDVPPTQETVPSEDLCHVRDLPQRLQQPDFLSRYTCLYTSAPNVREIMAILDQHHLEVPRHLSYVVHGESIPTFFHGRTPAMLQYTQSALEHLTDWLLHYGTPSRNKPYFRRKIKFNLIAGETLANQNAP